MTRPRSKFPVIALVVALATILLGCAETELVVHTAKETAVDDGQLGVYKVGKPYQIAGVWYYPREDYEYVETGIASWYGPGFNGKKTANGEIYDSTKMTAAHRTLPLPSIVRVTNLENGRSVKVRVNDRGPFKKSRIIDLSRKAARLLGFERKGTAKVRVAILSGESRQAAVTMQQDEASALAPAAAPREPVTAQPLTLDGAQPAQSADVPVPLITASSVAGGAQTAARPVVPQDDTVTRLPVGPSNIYVQVGAFAQVHNAVRMKARVASLGETQIIEQRRGATALFHVHIGPVYDVVEADRLVRRLATNGINDVQLVVR